MEFIGSSHSKETRQSTEPLSIEIGEQAELFHRLNILRKGLEESPLVIPDWTRITLKAIPLRRHTKQNPGAYMNIESGSKIAGSIFDQGLYQDLSHATITITDKSKPISHAQSLYTFRPGAEVWESWARPKQAQPDATYSNTIFLDVLDSQIPDELFQPLYDKIPTGTEIANLLIDHLQKGARSSTRIKRYSTTSIITGGKDYRGSRTTELLVSTKNDRNYQALRISGVHLSDYGPITETVGYGTEADNNALITAGGFVKLESGVEIPQARLDAYAIGKQLAGRALECLNKGRDELYEFYLPESDNNPRLRYGAK